MGNRKLKAAKRNSNIKQHYLSEDEKIAFVKNIVIDIKYIAGIYESNSFDMSKIDFAKVASHLQINNFRKHINNNKLTMLDFYDGAIKNNAIAFCNQKKTFIDNMKKLNVEIIYIKKPNPKVFQKGDTKIEVNIILENDIDTIFEILKYYLLKSNKLDDNIVLEDYIFEFLNIAILCVNNEFLFRNLNGNFIHLKNALIEQEGYNECIICMDNVNDNKFLSLVNCPKCSFICCGECYKKLKCCSSCNLPFNEPLFFL